MAKACQGEQGVALFSLWEAETCIKAAELVLWPHIKQAKQTGGAARPSLSMAPADALALISLVLADATVAGMRGLLCM